MKQLGLFTPEDDKTPRARRKRKRHPEDRGQLKLFAERDVLQFGVNAKPLIPLSPLMKLPLLDQARDQETAQAKADRMARLANNRTPTLV